MDNRPASLDEQEFSAVVNSRSGSLLAVASRLSASGSEDVDSELAMLTRPLVAVILSEAIQLEELLDAYGALGNERWRRFRRVVAAMKLFARVHYSLLHLAHAAPQYQLFPV